MKTLLLVGGILFLLLGAILLVAAVIFFFVARNRRAPVAAAPTPRPAAPPPPPPPPVSVQPPPTPPPPKPLFDEDATVVVGGGYGSLQATSGPLTGQSFPLKLDGFFIGRDKTLAQVIVEDPSVSKKHVWVGVRDGVVTAIDQSSTNGTYLNTLGTRIGQVRLAPGDTLILSDDVARFVYKA